MGWLKRLRQWFIVKLGGSWDTSPQAHMQSLLVDYIPWAVYQEAKRAFNKVETDPSFKTYEGSNLGRNILRDEAAEWTKLYLRGLGVNYRDSDVNLACELIYHLRRRIE